MGGAGWFFLILFLIVLAWAGWLGYKIFNLRKRNETFDAKRWQSYVPFVKTTGGSTTNYPTPRSAGPIEWIKDKIEGLRNKRTTTGGYEDTRGNDGAYQNLQGGGTRGRGRGLEDDAWDTRVESDPYGPGPGGYDEERELGLAPTPAPAAYGESDYMAGSTSYGGGRGRSAERDSGHLDPFSDAHAAASMRTVSPRPDLGVNTQGHRKQESEEYGNTSPISTRKSIFREDVS